LQLRIENVRLGDGELVPVRLTKHVEAAEQQVAVAAGRVVPAALSWAASSLIFYDFKGKDATIPAGKEILAYISGGFPLDPAKFQADSAGPKEKSVPK